MFGAERYLDHRQPGLDQRLRQLERVERAVQYEHRDDRRGAHDCVDRHATSSIALNMADAPCSALSAVARMKANSSRPVPMGGGGGLARSREARSTSTASNRPS